MRNLTKAGIVLVACCLAGGCKKDPQAELERASAPYKPGAASRIERLKALAPTMKAAAPIAGDGIALEGGNPVSVGSATAFDAINAGYLYEEDLGDIASPHTRAPFPVDRDMLFGKCGAQLAGRGFTPAHQQVQLYKNCGNAKYAVLVRTTKSQAPVVNDAEKTFTPGMVAGEVHVWNLDSGKRLGGFRFSVASDGRVKVDTRGLAGGTREVTNDLAIKMELAIKDGLAKFAR